MRYLAKITGLPNKDTGEMKVIIPSLSNDEVRVAYPLKAFLGIYEPYKLGDIVIVEFVENRLYYGDRPYAVGEFKTNLPTNAYVFACPFGYISFTPDSLVLHHVKGGKFVLTDKSYEPDIVTTSDGTNTSISENKYLKITDGTPISDVTKWR